MRVTFLGTSGAVPTTERNVSAVLLRREGERLLFDCGEGTQRQMMRFSTGFGIDHIFVTHLHADHILGIPGLLQTLAFNDRTDPLAIHTPHGTRGRLEDLITAAGDRPSFPLRIHQVQPGDTVLDHEDYTVEAFETDHRTNSVGYTLIEADRKGRFDRRKAEEELGLSPGPEYSKLHAGEPVEHDGRTIQPEEVVGPARPGRRVVYTGDTRPTAATVEAAEEADLLIHEATFADDRRERAASTGHTTASQAAELANRASATRLALTHISTRYAGNWRKLEQEARDIFEGENAFVAEDGQHVEVPFPEE
jgi:ribonuclease Z